MFCQYYFNALDALAMEINERVAQTKPPVHPKESINGFAAVNKYLSDLKDQIQWFPQKYIRASCYYKIALNPR